MFSPFESGSNSSRAEYLYKRISDWYGEECLSWASDVEKQLNISYSSCVSIGMFQKVTGRDLLRYNVNDFNRIVNEQYGPLFYKVFKKLAKEQKQQKVANKSSENEFQDLAASNYPTNKSSWTVPTLEIPDLTVPQISLNSSNTELSSFSPSLSLDIGQPYGGLSAYSQDGGNSYGGLSPSSYTLDGGNSFGGLSPSYTLEGGSSYGGLSPSYSLDGGASSVENQNGFVPTYFTQPSILSGGSLSYGNNGGTMLSPDELSFDFQSNDRSYSNLGENQETTYDGQGCTTLLPDFNSLMIGDKGNTYSDYLDIDEMDSSLKEETFSDLDQFIHNDDTFQSNFEIGNEFGSGMSENCGQESYLSTPNNGTLEDCMLKKITTGKRGNRVRHPQSWEFLVRLLMSPQTNPSLVKWENKEEGVFRLVQKEQIAKLWGKRSQKHKDEPLAYDNFARILRYHYKSKVLLPVSDKHLVYRLGDSVLANLKKKGHL